MTTNTPSVSDKVRHYFDRHPVQGWVVALPVGVLVVVATLAAGGLGLVALDWVDDHTPAILKLVGKVIGVGFVWLIIFATVMGAGRWALEKAGVVSDSGDFD